LTNLPASPGFAANGPKVTRDLGLAGAEYLHKIANANFLVGDEVEKAKPRAIGQGAKE
jgi:hypothetical protein